tara:strand:+ start:287 stop:955 length:669 start_codon:yes stop_codon:yes gene_type:complete
MSDFSKEDRLIEGLKNYTLTLREIQNGDWTYCGGNTGHHIKRWNEYWTEKWSLNNDNEIPDYPEDEDKCKCGHSITQQCYITNIHTDEVLVLGSTCINKFIPDGMKKKCNKCGNVHKNRKKNLCNTCQEICECGKTKVKKYDQCNTCMTSYECVKCQELHTNTHVNRCDKCRKGKCDSCNITIKEEYSKCFNCNYPNKCIICNKKCKSTYKTCYNCSLRVFL